MPKEQLNFRVSDLTRRQLDELGKRWGTTQSETLTVIIDRMYQQEIQSMNTPDYAQLAKNRVNSDGDLYADRDILLEYEWNNMTEHLEWVATADKAEILSWVLAIRDAENAVARNAEGE